MVDALDLGSSAERRVGSSPTQGTIYKHIATAPRGLQRFISAMTVDSSVFLYGEVSGYRHRTPNQQNVLRRPDEINRNNWVGPQDVVIK